MTGNGGYHNLHKVHSKPGDKADDTGAELKAVNDHAWGFLTLTINKTTITGATTEIDRTGAAVQGDTFHYPAHAITLQNPKAVPTL